MKPKISASASASSSRLISFWERAGMLLVLAALLVGCSLFVKNLASAVNMGGLLLAVSTVGIVSCTMLFCLASGNFDLSVGSVLACAGGIATVVIDQTGSAVLRIAAGLASGALAGAVNRAIVAKFKINPLITTLASMQIVRGLAYIVSNGKAVGVSQESFFALGASKLAGLPTPVWLCLACFLIFGFLLQSTTFGRNTLAIGGNEEAARLAGISVDRINILNFTLQGILAAFAGVILASRMTSGQPMS